MTPSFCSQCGASVQAEANFCPVCGTPVQKPPRVGVPPPLPPAPRSSTPPPLPMSAEEFSKTRIGKTYIEPDPQEMSQREQEMSRLREKYRRDKSDSMTGTPSSPPMSPMVGTDFPWHYIAGYYMRVRSFTRFAEVVGDSVGSGLPGRCTGLSRKLHDAA